MFKLFLNVNKKLKVTFDLIFVPLLSTCLMHEISFVEKYKLCIYKDIPCCTSRRERMLGALQIYAVSGSFKESKIRRGPNVWLAVKDMKKSYCVYSIYSKDSKNCYSSVINPNAFISAHTCSFVDQNKILQVHSFRHLTRAQRKQSLIVAREIVKLVQGGVTGRETVITHRKTPNRRGGARQESQRKVSRFMKDIPARSFAFSTLCCFYRKTYKFRHIDLLCRK